MSNFAGAGVLYDPETLRTSQTMDTEYLLLVGILLYTFRNESLHLLPTGPGQSVHQNCEKGDVA